ncbi:MAG TPA: TRAP transporter permease, partial [Rhodoferax sp.]|nr:TRAP transporter permease [Rhodoferax sp.]
MSLDLEPQAKTLARALFWVALLFSSFQLITAAFSPLSSQVVRAIHVGFVLLLIFTLYPPFEYSTRHAAKGRALGWLLGLTGFVFSLYHWMFEADLTQRAGELVAMDWVIGVVTVALVFEAARRVMGWGLPIICGVFLLYGLFGEHLPGALAHRGFGVDQIVS